MSMRERVYRYTDKPMSWTKAIIFGTLIWAIVIVLTGQAPSWIIYKVDQEIATLIEWSKSIPGVHSDGLNPVQIKIIRDIVANSIQMGALVAILVFAYFWQKGKQKRTGAKGPTDTVKGYLSGK